MIGPYLVMGRLRSEWRVLDAWVTEALAVTAADKLRWDVMTDHDRKNAKNPPTKWRFWEETASGYMPMPFGAMPFGGKFPGKIARLWKANSTGGRGRNPWSCIAVVKLEVQGTVLDQIVEAIE